MNITGEAGFIRSHDIRRFINKYPDYHIYNLDYIKQQFLELTEPLKKNGYGQYLIQRAKEL